MDPVYDLSRVSKIYGSRLVLNIAHFEILSGEVLAVVGPSGAGKSTFLRLLNFLEEPTGGTIRYQQQAVQFHNIPLKVRRSITTVFQHPALLSTSVETNLRFGLRLRGIKDMKESIDRIMEELGLCELRHAAVSTLSGGEAQRVALARALLLKPEVLLLDEPTANLDPYNVELIEKVIRRLNQSRQTTIILVTHNIFQAKRLADRVALLLNGEMIETAETAAFFENPKDPRALAFVRGEMVW